MASIDQGMSWAAQIVAASIKVATCTGWTVAIDGKPASGTTNSSAARAQARRVCRLRMFAAKNSRKRIEARSPAAPTILGTGDREMRVGTSTSILQDQGQVKIRSSHLYTLPSILALPQ